MPEHAGKHLLLLCTTTGYQTRAFVETAQKLGISMVFGTDRCHVLEDPWRDGAIPLRFEDPEASARKLVEYAASHSVDGVVAVGDRPGPTAALLAEALHWPAHPKRAADICRDKYFSREVLRGAGLKVPDYQRFGVDEDPRQILNSSALKVDFPCVLKPLALSGSRGVIRANTAAEFITAFSRIRTLLRSGEIGALREYSSNFIQLESYIEGKEVAVEGLVDQGKLHVLAIFDKPDPLAGPFFEETIYVTPSRLPATTQAEINNTVEQAVRALGLFHGPLHAEMRINESGVWPLEIAARPIGGLCARTLRFQENMSLEEVILCQALGERIAPVREPLAAGVMMIPIPQSGILEEVDNLQRATDTPGIEAIEITAKIHEKLVPLPEGSSYLGFIFARGESPEMVETALRKAHKKLRFVISPSLPVV